MLYCLTVDSVVLVGKLPKQYHLGYCNKLNIMHIIQNIIQMHIIKKLSFCNSIHILHHN